MSSEGLQEECENLFEKQDQTCLEHLCRRIWEDDEDNRIGSHFDYLCRNILKEDESNIVALNYNAFRFCRSGHHYLVFPILNRILELDGDNYFAYNTKALSHIDREEYEDALECCDKGLRINDHDWLRINKIQSLISLNRISEAHEFYKEREIPNYTFVKGLVNCGKYSEVSRFNDNLSGKELMDYYFDRCRHLENRRRKSKKETYEEMIDVCEEIFKIDNDNEEALEYKVHALAHLERHDDELKWSSHGIRLYPNNPSFYLHKAEELYCYSNLLDEAIECFEKGLSLVENVEWYPARDELVWALEDKAKEAIELGNYREAADIYDKILFYNKRKFEALDNIDSLVKEHDISYEYSESYNESLKLRMEIENKDKQIDEYLKTIEIGEYEAGYDGTCSEFKDYDSIDEYIKDIIICLMTSYKDDEESAKERVKRSMDNVKEAFKHGEPALDFAIVYGYSCG